MLKKWRVKAGRGLSRAACQPPDCGDRVNAQTKSVFRLDCPEIRGLCFADQLVNKGGRAARYPLYLKDNSRDEFVYDLARVYTYGHMMLVSFAPDGYPEWAR